MTTNKGLQFFMEGRFIRHRFIKFGLVGASGTVVNLVMLYINQEFLFKHIYPMERRLMLSLSGAIFLATMNNYLWNRWWTWKDRKGVGRFVFFTQMGQYYLACVLAIVLQYIFTLLLSRIIYYLVANIIAIVLAAILVYVINDMWTFAERKVGLYQKKGNSV